MHSPTLIPALPWQLEFEDGVLPVMVPHHPHAAPKFRALYVFLRRP
jgi:hypothetical protein